MAEQKPLVILNGQPQQLPAGDTLTTETPITKWINAREVISSPAVQINATNVLADKINQTSAITFPAGDYIVEINYLWNIDVTNNEFQAEFTIDGNAASVDGTRIHVNRARNASNAGDQVTTTGSGMRMPYSMKFPVTWATDATHDFVLSFLCQTNGSNCAMWDATISIYPAGGIF